MTPKFTVGDRVVVIECYSSYRNKYIEEVGTVETVYKPSKRSCSYGVRLDNYTNSASAKGLFWFEPSEIRNIESNKREETIMFNDFNVAEVEFINDSTSNKMRHAYALYDEGVQPEDIVVVNTGHHGFSLAKVVNILFDEESKKEVKFNREVVCRVDFTGFNNRRNAVKRATELKREMEKHMREAQEMALYEMLAEKDPTLKTMLDEYKALMDSCK